ncbi:MAG TPA: prolipoprotein diacylglyceryl transferase [Thermoanaerobaculia bacterium]|jgi:phosphatidylglycerol:prolipoprotein diacylglycerol transferase|nr:prolipoprotein diacylglyceryl transferase [Thermoanaerobaculia bacterium]
MIQELFHIGSFSISPFGVMLVFAFVGSYLQLRWGMRLQGIGDEEDASALVFAAGVGGIVGAKVYYALLYHSWRLLFDRSGLVWYGGFLLGAAAVLYTMRHRRLPAWPVTDALAPALALGYAIGRVGCFLVGDDYGRPTSLPWGVVFRKGIPPTTAGALRDFHVNVLASLPDSALVRVHPTQVYETLICLVIWWLGVRLLRREAAPDRPRGAGPGGTALPVLGLLAIERFLVEILRAKDDRFLGPFTLAQAISILVFLVVSGLWFARRRTATAPHPA